MLDIVQIIEIPVMAAVAVRKKVVSLFVRLFVCSIVGSSESLFVVGLSLKKGDQLSMIHIDGGDDGNEGDDGVIICDKF